jgi:hypothetical protein
MVSYFGKLFPHLHLLQRTISHGNCSVWRPSLLLSVSKAHWEGRSWEPDSFSGWRIFSAFSGTGNFVPVFVITRQLSQPMPSLTFSLLLKVIYNSLKELRGVFDLVSVEILSTLCWVLRYKTSITLHPLSKTLFKYYPRSYKTDFWQR